MADEILSGTVDASSTADAVLGAIRELVASSSAAATVPTVILRVTSLTSIIDTTTEPVTVRRTLARLGRRRAIDPA